MKTVLVTDAEQRSALAVVRSLGAAGYRVEVCSRVGGPLAGASRHCRSEHRVPDPGEDAHGFVEAVRRLVVERRVDLLVPMTDVSSTLLIPALQDTVRIPSSPARDWAEITDKRRLLEVADSIGIPVPRQVVIESPEASLDSGPVRQLAAEAGFPLYVKPHRSAVLRDGRVSKLGVGAVSSLEEYEAVVSSFGPEAFPLLVQERIDGEGLGVFMLFRDGREVAHFAHRRLREKPPTGGVSVYRESVPVRDDLRRYSADLLKEFRWSGVAMIEFKEDAASGTAYLMEVNARFWGSLQLAIDAGVDFPRLLVDAAFDDPTDAVAAYRTGVRSRWLWGDVDHALWMLRAPRGIRRAFPRLPGRTVTLARVARPWWFGDRLEVLRLSDPGPFLRESVAWLRALKPFRRR